MKKSIIFYCFCLVLISACGQSNHSTSDAIRRGHISITNDTIPLKNAIGKNWIVINAVLDDSINAKLVLDNGTKWMVYLDKTFALEKGLIKSSSASEVDRFRKVKLPFEVGLLKDTAINTILFGLKELVGEEPDGLLGADFIKKYVLELNYKNKYLIFHDSHKFTPPPTFTRLSMTSRSKGAKRGEIDLKLFFNGGNIINEKVTLDLGKGSDGLFLGGGFVRKHNLLKLVNSKELKSFGKFVSQEDNMGYELVLDSVQFGTSTINNVTAQLSISRAGQSGTDIATFGNSLLSKLEVVFIDLAGNRLYIPLKPSLKM